MKTFATILTLAVLVVISAVIGHTLLGWLAGGFLVGYVGAKCHK